MTDAAISPVEHRRLLARYGTSRSGHAVFSPSGSAAWLNCSRSLLANLNYPDRGSFEAAEGTVAHQLAERTLETQFAERMDRLTDEFHPSDEIGVVHEVREQDGTIHAITVDQTMVDHVLAYVDWCFTALSDDFLFFGIECRVDLSFLLPIGSQGGTADCVCINRDGTVVITDLKYGKGVPVSAVENTQFMLYALGVYREWSDLVEINRFVLRCCQPRLGTFEEWPVSVEKLLEFEQHVIRRANDAWNENAPATPSLKACRWCKHKVNCEANIQQVDALMAASFEDGPAEEGETESSAWIAVEGRLSFRSREVGECSDAYLVSVLEWQKWSESYFGACRAELERRALHRDIAGTKEVMGKGSREWVSREQAVKALVASNAFTLDEIAPRVLLSVPQAEESLKKRKVRKRERDAILDARVVRYVPGKPTLVLVTDRRPSMPNLVEQSFPDADDYDI